MICFSARGMGTGDLILMYMSLQVQDLQLQGNHIAVFGTRLNFPSLSPYMYTPFLAFVCFSALCFHLVCSKYLKVKLTFICFPAIHSF